MLGKPINMFKKVNVSILGIIQNMSYLKIDEKKNYLFGKNGAFEESKKQNLKFLGEIPIYSEISNAGDSGIPLTSKNNSCINDVFENISDQLIESLDKDKTYDVKISN